MIKVSLKNLICVAGCFGLTKGETYQTDLENEDCFHITNPDHASSYGWYYKWRFEEVANDTSSPSLVEIVSVFNKNTADELYSRLTKKFGGCFTLKEDGEKFLISAKKEMLARNEEASFKLYVEGFTDARP